MPISSPRLRRLDDALASLPPDSDAMLLSELDGFVAGLIVCPEPVPPDEWLPLVWGDGEELPFADGEEARWYAGLVTDHLDAVGRTIRKGQGRYAPFLEVDRRHDEVLWELWIEGFAAAMGLRPDAWAGIGNGTDAAAVAALAGMVTLAEIARDESDLPRETIDALTGQAPGLIPAWVDALAAWQGRGHPALLAAIDPSPPARVGRNDPCPCGSGAKHKKCCGGDRA